MNNLSETDLNLKHQKIAFTGGRLICGSRKGAIEDSVILIEGDRIKAVGENGETPIPAATTKIDITGKTIMPGLIDAHVHAGNLEVSMKKTADILPAVYVLRVAQILETDLQLGFTTLRDAAGLDWSFKVAVNQGLIRGPRLFISANPMTPSGGHFDERGRSRENPLPRNSLGIYPEIRDGINDVLIGTRQVIRRGADQVKVAADGGVSSPTDQPGEWQYSVEELRTIVETAKASGKYVMAHAYGPKAIMNCLEAGVKSIEHGNLLDEACAAKMAEQGAYYVPTLVTYDILADEASDDLSDFYLEKNELVRQAGKQAVEMAMAAGVNICSGSDIIGPFQHLKGREIRIKGEIMGAWKAIVSATKTNAELIGMEKELGTLEPGKLADLIVLNGNPLEDLSIFEKTMEKAQVVMKEGMLVKNLL